MSDGIRSSLRHVAPWLDGELVGPDAEFAGVSTDTRNIGPGNLFIALRGPRHDAHDHLDEAVAGGAAALMVERESDAAAPQLLVADSRRALGALGAGWRRERGLPVVAVTGSNGKTTVKEMIAAILGQGASVLATRGNLNNEIGVPLTLLSLTSEHRFAVVEMGANHAGEIALLTRMAGPQVAVLNNAGPAHLEGFGSLEGVARAKAEIFEGLDADGVAVFNGDSPFAEYWADAARGRPILRFGMEQPSEIRGDWQPAAGGGSLEVEGLDEPLAITLPLPGRHNGMNALAAIAASHALGIPAAQIRQGLEAMRPVPGRLGSVGGRNGSRLIDDTYNANPASLDAALDVLSTAPGRRVLVLGDMGELGPGGAELHAEAGRLAREKGIDALFATGPLSAGAVEAFGAGGNHFEDQDALTAALGADLGPDTTVLIKGSRSQRMERIVAALADNNGE